MRYRCRALSGFLGLAALLFLTGLASATESYLIRYTLTRLESSRETILAKGVRRVSVDRLAQAAPTPSEETDGTATPSSWIETLRSLIGRPDPPLVITDEGRRWTYRWHPTSAPDTTLRFDAEILKHPGTGPIRKKHRKSRIPP